eukprot:s3494_g6.t1
MDPLERPSKVKWKLGVDTEQFEINSQEGHPDDASVDDLFGVTFSGSEVRSLEYEPSIAQTDFSGFLPWHVLEEEVELTADYKPEAVVQSAWNSLQSESYKLPWETGFWDQFLNPQVTVWDQMSSGFKRPFYAFLKSEAEQGAKPSRLKACFEAVVFARFVLGIEVLQQVVSSRRCLGAASHSSLGCPRQADAFTVKQLTVLHSVLRDDEELWNKCMAGMILFCVYARSRWSDAQHAEELIADYDTDHVMQFLEVKTAVHKTARAFHVRHMYLPLSAPSYGVTDDNWGVQWMHVRNRLNIANLKEFPLMPAPDKNLEPTRRPVSTQEAKLWIQYLLGSEMSHSAKLTSHSCKCTCLSFMAKRGVPFEDRLALGYHSNKMRMALVYSRDGVARPLALLSHVLGEIRKGIFEPDNTRSGRLHSGAVDINKVGGRSVFEDVTQDVEQSEPGSWLETSAESSLQSWCKVSSEAHVEQHETREHSLAVEVQDPVDEGHVTTDSSDSSDDEGLAWGPVVGHYEIELPADKALWRNQHSKMFHLSHEDHVRVLLCGRRISASFVKHSGAMRFDSAKCRQCFRLKDS